MFFFSAYLVQRFYFNRPQAADANIVLAFWSIVMLNTVVKWMRIFFSVEVMMLMTGALLTVSMLLISFCVRSYYIYLLAPVWAFGATGFYTYFLVYLSDHAGKESQGVAMGGAMSLQRVAHIVSPILVWPCPATIGSDRIMV